MADMMEIQFYRNKYNYPDYSPFITAITEAVQCTPVNFGSRQGTIKVSRQYLDMESVNYLRFKRGSGMNFYAWITDIQFHTDNSFLVSYQVDAWRTFQYYIKLDNQFIARTSAVATHLKDDLLGSTQPYNDIIVKDFTVQKYLWRTLVVQVKPTSDNIFSRSPVQPSPYLYYVTDYEVNNWTAQSHINTLMSKLSFDAESTNIVTLYSLPYMNTSALPAAPLIVKTSKTDAGLSIDGFKVLDHQNAPGSLLFVETPITFDIDVAALMRVNHSVQIVIPDAGIMDVPDELLMKPNLRLRQDVDLYSGASNYMLVYGTGSKYTASIRGAAINSIPVTSDPYDTYISQNQNALATTLLGDVATAAAGVGTMVLGGPAGMAVGGGMLMQSVTSMMNTSANANDAGASATNPPAFLGTALANQFSQQFWMVIKQTHVTNEGLVHSECGYPYNMMAALEFPWEGGYIETRGCCVSSTDGRVPKWAMEEVNQMFDKGVECHMD